MMQAMIDGVPQLPPDALFLSLDGRMIPATPRPDLGKEFFLADTPNGLLFLRSEDGVEAEDMTPEVTKILRDRLRVQKTRARRNQDAQITRLRAAQATDPLDWQDKHDPVEKIMVAHSIGTKIVEDGNRGHAVVEVKRLEAGKQRIVDARLAATLGGDRMDAMEEIYRGFCALTSGIGMKPASVERASKAYGGISEGQAASATDYNAWVEFVDNSLFLDQDSDINRHGKPMIFGRGKGANRWTLERLSPEAATAIICHGMTVDEVAAQRRKDKTWVRNNLKQAIDVWLCMKNRQPWPEYGTEDTAAPLTLKQVLTRQLNRKVSRVRHAEASEQDRVIRDRSAA